MSEMLYDATQGLNNELKYRGFSSVVSSGSSTEGVRKIQQHEYPLW